MDSDANLKEAVSRLRTDVEARYGHPLKTSRDFEQLSEAINGSQHQHVSATTLKRMWGYINEPVTPRLSTLHILARYVGAADFNDYRAHLPLPQDPPTTKRRRLPLVAMGVAVVAILAVVVAVAPTIARQRTAAKALPGVAVDKVIKRGDHFGGYDDYLKLFGIHTQDCEWYQTVPGVKGVCVWSPSYQHPRWHNEVDTAAGCPTIREYWTPDPKTRKPYMTLQYETLFNRYRLYHDLNENAVRITFMKDFKHRSGFTFMGIYRLDPQRSTEQSVVFELVDTTCVLADLAKFRGYAARINR